MERRAGIPSNKIIVGGFSQGEKKDSLTLYLLFLEMTLTKLIIIINFLL